MGKRNIGLFTLGLIAGIVAVWAALALQPTANAFLGRWCIAPRCHCGGSEVQAKIHSGPDAGTDLSGDLVLAVNADGTFSGDLVRKSDGARFRVTGQGSGRGGDLVIELGGDQRLFSHISQDYDIRECRGGMRGNLIGPRYGNFGDWGRRV